MSRTRRSNNSGSITRRSDGRYEARLTLPDGRRKSYYGKTWGEAERKLQKARSELEAGLVPAFSNKMTVAEFGQRWLEMGERRWRRLTYENYERRWRLSITPVIGRVKLSALSPAHIQLVIAEAQKQGFADATVHTLRAIMVTSFDDAVKWRLLTYNPARGITVSRGEGRSLPETLTREQIAALIEAMKGHRYHAFYLLGTGLGLRWSEARGLRWSDIDLDAGIIRVRHSLYVRDGQPIFDGLKSKSSRRDLPIPAFLAESLKRQRRDQLLRRLRSRQEWIDRDLVNDGYGGGPVSSPAILRGLRDMCKDVGLDPLTFHHLRHLCATLLIMEGVPLKTIQAILGHSDAKVTMDIYMHLNRELLDTAAEAMDRIFREAAG